MLSRKKCTRLEVLVIVGQLVRHLPASGWIRMICRLLEENSL